MSNLPVNQCYTDVYLRCFSILADLVLYVAASISQYNAQEEIEGVRGTSTRHITHITVAIMIMVRPQIQVEGGGTG